MYRVIRAGTEYGLMIAVSPADATPDSTNAKFYRFATWGIGDHKANQFNEITSKTAITYFGGIAEGVGYEKPPEMPFPTLDAILEWRKTMLNIHETFSTKKITLLAAIADVEQQLQNDLKRKHLLRHRVQQVLLRVIPELPTQMIEITFKPKPDPKAKGDHLFLR